MRKIFLFIAFISMYFLGQAQYAPTSSKTRFVNGIGLSTKDTASLSNAGDTLAMIVGKDSLVYFKYKGYWKPIAYNSSLNSYVKYSDTSSMLSPYQRSFSAMKYSDTATMLSSYYNKTATNSLLNTKLNTSDTATMLSGYKTYYPRNAISAGTGISYNPSTGVITNTSSGTVTSVATNNGSGITGGTITTSGTIAADTSVLATRLRVQKGIDSLGAAKISGSGSGNYVAKFTGVGVTIGNSTMQDDGSKVSMSGQLEVGGYVKAGTSIQSEAYQNLAGGTALSLSSGVGIPRVLVGVPTDDNTNKLQVQGGTRITGQLTLGSTITNGTYTYTLPSATGTIALVGGSGVGTVTSVATDATMTGGTITTTGTLKVDTTVMATRLRVQKGIDSVNANVNLKVNISDTATMLSSYYNKTATDSKLALKLNISDTATMLSPYARTLALGGYIPYTGATGAIDLNAKTVVNISHLGINTTTVPTILIRAIGDNNSTSRIAIRGYSSDANSSSMRVTKFRGTTSAPQAPQSGDNLGKFELAGYGTTSSEGYPQATFEALATENWGATARGAKVQVKVTPNTTITQAIALTINQDKTAKFENSIILGANATNDSTINISQTMANNDNWKIFGTATTGDKGELVFKVGDNGVPYDLGGERFRFSFDTTSAGSNMGLKKDVLIIDYDSSYFTTRVVANSFRVYGSSDSYLLLGGGGTVATSSFAPATGGSYLPLSGGTLTGALNGTSANFTSFGNFYGQVSLYDYTQSTSSSTGCFVVNGGIGVAKNIYSSGNIISTSGTIATLNGGGIEVYTTGNANYFNLTSPSNGNFLLKVNVGGSPINALNILNTGVANFSSRLNVNGATDDGSTSLNVTGTGRFSDALSGTSATFTSTITATGSIQSNDVNAYKLYQSGNAVDEKYWSIQNIGNFRIRALNDALTSGINGIDISRSGIASVSIVLGGTTTIANSGTFTVGSTAGTGTGGLYAGAATFSSRVNVNGATDDGITALNVSGGAKFTSTTQGFLMPRMTSTQRTAISSPAEGLLVIQTDGTMGLYLYINSAWHAIIML
jgi:hypothetical protein